MLQSGKAKAVSVLSFTIQLTYRPETQIRQSVVVGCDPGRTNIGLAAVREDGTCLYRAHCITRNKEIAGLMADRLAHRRESRRGERLVRKRLAKKLGTTAKKLLNRILPGCKEPLTVKDIINTEARFHNRLRPQGWLTPSAEQLFRTHFNLIQNVQKLLPVTDIAVELNRFAFMQLDQPEVKKRNIDFRHGPLYGSGGLERAVKEQQQGRCLLCGKDEPLHFHHIVPRSKRGSNTIANIAGLCIGCHELVHKNAEAAEKLETKKKGLNKKYGDTSVLNQIIPSLTRELSIRFPDHTYVTTGWETKQFREDHKIEKDHDLDAYCIAAGSLSQITPKIQADSYEIRQFRRHNRATIHHQTERTYKLDGKAVAKNRHKRKDQKTDSLQEWYEEMVQKFGMTQAEKLRSGLTVQKSTRYYNRKERMMPGTVFRYNKKRYVLTGQLTGGAYYRAYGQERRNFPAGKVQVLQKNAGLVYVA